MTSSWPGAGGARRRGRPSRLEQVRLAREAAADAFVAMDRGQRDVRVTADALANLDPGSTATERVRGEAGGLDARAETLAAAYIGVLDTYPSDGDETAPAAALDQAARAFAAVEADLRTMTTELAAFPQRHAAALERVNAALAEVLAQGGAAATALDAARREVAGRRAEGLTSTTVDRALLRAEDAARVLARGVSDLGLSGAARAAATVVELAGQARAAARDLPERRRQLTNRISSLRTRADAVEHRAATLSEPLSQLRRLYVEECSRPYADLPGAAAAAVTRARELVTTASSAVAGGDDMAAADAVRAADAVLEEVDGRMRDLRRRRDELADLRADPAGRIRAVRFSVRDAQRLVMQGQDTPPPRWAARLDPLSTRLEAATALLDRPRVDWWALWSELEAISRAVAAVVSEVRAQKH